MSQQIDAIYENGVFKPMAPLSLPDRARVMLTLEPQTQARAEVQPQDEWERGLVAIAKDCGISLSDSALGSEELYD